MKTIVLWYKINSFKVINFYEVYKYVVTFCSVFRKDSQAFVVSNML